MDQTQDEGGTASFTCQATGGPVPTISWYLNGVPVDEANMMKYTISMMSVNTTTINSTLTIMSVESSDVGTYTCNATNVVSSDTSSGVLTVNGESTCLNLKRKWRSQKRKQVASNIAITHHPCSIVYCMCLLKYRTSAG